MSTPHYIAFVGASASLSSELSSLKKRIAGLSIIVPAMRKEHRKLTSLSIERVTDTLFGALTDSLDNTGYARLSIWCYEPSDQIELNLLFQNFGKAGWVEFVPAKLKDKDALTRAFIEKRIGEMLPMLHEVSVAVFGGRKTSPLTLPLENFQSRITAELKRLWYRELKINELKKEISRLTTVYKQIRFEKLSGYKDERHLIFSPAKDGALHGIPHPTGSSVISFIAGRFRFGVAIFPGFHYDVSSAKSKILSCTVVDSDGKSRSLKAERRTYINIFPNDHILPENKQ